MRALGILTALAVVSAPLAQAAGDPYPSHYLNGLGVAVAHVSACERAPEGPGPSRRREGGADAVPAAVNTPLLAGDQLTTPASSRCELRFDTGTLVRLDENTSLRIEALLAPSITTDRRLTNLVLEQGRLYIRYRDSKSAELFQVLTPNAAIQLEGSARAYIDLAEAGRTSLEVVHGAARLLYGPDPAAERREKVRNGQRIVVGPGHSLEPPGARLVLGNGGLGQWSDERDRSRGDGRKARASLPDLSLYPPVVAEFADEWSTRAGTWERSSVYGDVWRPQLAGDPSWKPYSRGRWDVANDPPVWIADEPWGWVPSHFGSWTWITEWGWSWIPGPVFAAAWVEALECEDEIFWRPWPFWSAMRSRSANAMALDTLADWRCRPWDPRGRNRAESWQPRGAREGRRTSFSPPVAPPSRPGRPDRPNRHKWPPELMKLSERVAVALQAGHPELSAELRVVAGASTAIPRPQARSGRGEDLPIKPVGPGERNSDRAPAHASTQTDPAVPTANGPDPAPEPAAEPAPRSHGRTARGGDPGDAPRFRDWNPDVRSAREHGGRVTYSGPDHRPSCDDCRQPLASAWSGDGGGGSSESGGSGSDGFSGSESGGRDSDSGRGSDGPDHGSGGDHDKADKP